MDCCFDSKSEYRTPTHLCFAQGHRISSADGACHLGDIFDNLRINKAVSISALHYISALFNFGSFDFCAFLVLLSIIDRCRSSRSSIGFLMFPCPSKNNNKTYENLKDHISSDLFFSRVGALFVGVFSSFVLYTHSLHLSICRTDVV